MAERDTSREEAVERLDNARRQRADCSDEYESARGSVQELTAFTELQAAEDQFAAREAWVKWIERDY